jgi:hypothetical protein
MSDRSKALILYADDVEIIVDTVTPWISMTGVADPDRGLGAGLSPECWRQMGDACRRAADRQEAIERGSPESITAPADPTKPAACGACGAERLGRGFRDWKVDGRYRRESKILCACGVEGPWAPCHPATDDAVAAWNRMWAPRAGEATKRLLEPMARWHAKAVRQGLDSYNLAFFKGIDRGNIDYFHSFADFEAMCLELGLAGGEGRG